MPKVYLYRSGFSLFPAYLSDNDLLMKYREGEVIEATVKKARNPKFHRKFFALVKVGFEAQTNFVAFEWWREYITMKAGHYESCKAPNGEWMYRAKSIRFDQMDDLEFEQLYRDVSQAIIRECKITEQQINDNIELFL